MKTSKFFFSTLIAAAAMTATAYADTYTIGTADNNSNVITSATAEDTIVFEKESGFLTAGGGVINAGVVIDSLKLTDGYSGVTYTFKGQVTGGGEFSFNPTTNADNQNYVFEGDVSGYSGNMLINANRYGSFTFNNNATGSGTITATSAWCNVNFNGATVNNSEINVATINVRGETSFVTSTKLVGKVVVDSSATFENSGSLDISGARFVLNGNSIVNTGTVVVSSGTIFDLTSVDGAQTIISGGSVMGWDSLSASNFTLNGDALGGRSSLDLSVSGSVTVSVVVANLVWSGATNSTWDVEATANWVNGEAPDVFYVRDNVEFTSNGAGTVNVVSDVTVGDFVVSSGTYTLTRSGNGHVNISGNATVENGAKLILGSQTNDTGLLRGAIVVENGGTLQFDQKDVTGYSGGATSLHTITVSEGGVLLMNVNGNETFAGKLNLGGTIKNGELAGNDTYWDIFGSSSIEVMSSSAKIETNLRIRRGDAIITLNNGSLLTVSGNITVGGNGTDTLKIDGGNDSGSFVFTGETGTIGKGVKLGRGSFTIGDGERASFLSVGRVEMGDSGTSGQATLAVKANSTLKVVGNNNGSGYKDASLLLGEWVAKTIVDIEGTLLAKDAKALVGDNNMEVSIKKGGVLAVNGLGVATLKNDKAQGISLIVENGGLMILGSEGIATSKTWSGSVAEGTIATYSDAEAGTTIANSLELTSASGATFDTQKYVFAENGNSISRGSSAGKISVSGALSGIGKLIKIGAGTLTLSEGNSYSGGTTISAGTLVASHENALGSGAVAVENGVLELSKEGSIISASAITVANGAKVLVAYGTGATYERLTLNGGATLEIRNGGGSVGTIFGDIVVDRAGELAAVIKTGYYGDGSAIEGTISGNGALEFTGVASDGKNPTEVKAAISGSLAVNVSMVYDKESPQVLTFSGTNSYSGGTTINSGVLKVTNSKALGTGAVTFKGGELDLAADVEISELNGEGQNVLENSNIVNSGADVKTLTVEKGSFDGGIVGKRPVGGSDVYSLSLVKTGNDKLSLRNYLSAQSITVAGGVLSWSQHDINKNSNYVVDIGETLTVKGGAQLDLLVGDEVKQYSAVIVGGDVNLASRSKIVVDLSNVTAGGEEIVLNIIAANAINFGWTETSEALIAADGYSVEDFVSITGDEHLAAYVNQMWSYSNGALSLTLAIPEPSMFGLLAGLGALALAGTRRRRK